MTDDYKEQLLNYVTGNLETTSPTTDEIFLEQLDIDRSTWVNYLPPSWQNFRYEGMVQGDERTSGLSVLYGGYINSNGETKGIITLVNENFEPVKTIYSFVSGTDLRYIQYMKQAEDGNFYFIDDEVFSFAQKQQSETSQKRFVMVNNLTVPFDNEYYIRLRTSYIIPDNLKNFYCREMFKDPNSSHYIFFGGAVDNTSIYYNRRILKIFGLKINVGQANEWTSYVSQNQALFGSAFAQFNNDSDVYFRCVWTNNLNNSRAIDCYTKTYTGNPSSSAIMQFGYHPYIDEEYQEKQSFFINMNEVYFVQNNQYWGNGSVESKYIGLYKHNFSNNTNETLYEKYLGEYDYTYQEYIMIDKNITDIYIEYVNNYDRPNSKADYYVQRYNGTWNPVLIAEQKPFVFDQRGFFVKNNFNLLQIYTYGINPRIPNWYWSVIKEDYNILNYNGEPYVNTNVLSPFKAQLYSNGNIIFARNLYNISKQNNMTMASVEIPNNCLNDLTITQNDLISETNLQMNSDDTQWTKNIYEVVDLNFLNTISVIDEDTSETYLQGAIRVNNSITDINDYEDAKCTKYRINYTDTTTQINNLEWLPINKYNKTTQITFYADKNITSIDLISEDETTVYLSIPVEVEIGNYYTIRQKVRTGNKPTPVQLQYNNENINYNNEPVMVYVEEV